MATSSHKKAANPIKKSGSSFLALSYKSVEQSLLGCYKKIKASKKQPKTPIISATSSSTCSFGSSLRLSPKIKRSSTTTLVSKVHYEKKVSTATTATTTVKFSKLNQQKINRSVSSIGFKTSINSKYFEKEEHVDGTINTPVILSATRLNQRPTNINFLARSKTSNNNNGSDSNYNVEQRRRGQKIAPVLVTKFDIPVKLNGVSSQRNNKQARYYESGHRQCQHCSGPYVHNKPLDKQQYQQQPAAATLLMTPIEQPNLALSNTILSSLVDDEDSSYSSEEDEDELLTPCCTGNSIQLLNEQQKKKYVSPDASSFLIRNNSTVTLIKKAHVFSKSGDKRSSPSNYSCNIAADMTTLDVKKAEQKVKKRNNSSSGGSNISNSHQYSGYLCDVLDRSFSLRSFTSLNSVVTSSNNHYDNSFSSKFVFGKSELCKKEVRALLAWNISFEKLLQHSLCAIQKPIQLNLTEKDQAIARFIVNELCSTEKTYYQFLIFIRTNYMKPMQTAAQDKNPLVKSSDVRILFYYLPDLMAMSKKLLCELENYAQGLTLQNVSPGMAIGRIFKGLDSDFSVFLKYAIHYQSYMKAIRRASHTGYVLKIDSESKVLKSRENNRLGLEDYLIAPFQRVPRYELLLKDLLKYTDTQVIKHPENPNQSSHHELIYAQNFVSALATSMDQAQ